MAGIAIMSIVAGLSGSASIKTIKQSLAWNNSLFVRVPGPGPAPGQTVRRASQSGWCFQHVVAGPRREPGMPEAQWYLARDTSGRHALPKKLVSYP